MGYLVDSDIAIHMRDGDQAVASLMAGLDAPPFLSILTRVELEGGVVRNPHLSRRRRIAIDNLLARLVVLPFDGPCADAYGRIIAVTGWSRVRIFDRMIAATAIVHELTLITMNRRDFANIPGLSLETWPSPAA